MERCLRLYANRSAFPYQTSLACRSGGLGFLRGVTRTAQWYRRLRSSPRRRPLRLLAVRQSGGIGGGAPFFLLAGFGWGGGGFFVVSFATNLFCGALHPGCGLLFSYYSDLGMVCAGWWA